MGLSLASASSLRSLLTLPGVAPGAGQHCLRPGAERLICDPPGISNWQEVGVLSVGVLSL